MGTLPTARERHPVGSVRYHCDAGWVLGGGDTSRWIGLYEPGVRYHCRRERMQITNALSQSEPYRWTAMNKDSIGIAAIVAPFRRI